MSKQPNFFKRNWRAFFIVVLGLPALAVVTIALLSQRRLGADFSGVKSTLSSSFTGDVERGRYAARTRGCMDCHGEDFTGQVMVDGPVLRLVASNLTAPTSASIDASRFDLALRHAVGGGGRPLIGMPSGAYSGMSDEETADLRAYLLSLPAVTNELPASGLDWPGRTLMVLGQISPLEAESIDHSRRAPSRSPAKSNSVEYGRYVALTCQGCHGDDLAGGQRHGPPDFPESANLTRHADGIATWTLSDFRRALREGIRPDHSAIDARAMPIGSTKALDDTDTAAMWLFMRQLEPRPSKR